MDDDSLLLDDNRRSIFPGCEPRMFSVSGDHTLRQWNVKTGRFAAENRLETADFKLFLVVLCGFKRFSASKPSVFQAKQVI